MKTVITILMLLILNIHENSPVGLSEIRQVDPEWIEKKKRQKESDEMQSYREFMKIVAKIESNDNARACNKYNYLGKYQMGKAALKQIGIEIDVKEFKENENYWTEHEQDVAMYKLIKNNERMLQRQINKYAGKNVNGIHVTKERLLIAAHLGGPGSVKKWLESNEDFEDANGTTITKWMSYA